MIENELTESNFGYRYETLKLRSKKKIIISCDYCGLKYSTTCSNRYKSELNIKKDCCITCRPLKIKEICLSKYGVNNPAQINVKNINENFFKEIDNEYKAYWLGFIAADGCVNSKLTATSISLAIKDKNHISKFNNILNSEYKIGFTDSTCSISISNPKFTKELLKFGITPRKSLNLKINLDLIPKELHRHFWRGYFDGDGSILYNFGDSKWSVSLTSGSRKLLEQFNEFIRTEILGRCGKIYLGSGALYVRYSGNKSTKSITNHLYGNSNIFLDRKKILADHILSNTEPVPGPKTKRLTRR